MKIFHGTNIVIEQPKIINRLQTLILYEAGQLEKESAIKKFKVKKLYNQVVFCNELILSSLVFIKSYKVEF